MHERTSRPAAEASLAAQGLPTNTYKMTLVSIPSKGAFTVRVIDSRYDDIDEVWSDMIRADTNNKIIYRLIVAEDLPEETEALLERMLHGDREMLLDHTSNRGHTVHGWDESHLQNPKAEFHVNLSEPSTAYSVALPYEIYGKSNLALDGITDVLDHKSARTISDRMEQAVRSMERQPCGLRTSWLIVPPRDPGIQRLLFVAYKRVSIQFVPQVDAIPSTCILLMYPPMAPVKATDAVFRVSSNLAYPLLAFPLDDPKENPRNRLKNLGVPPVSAGLTEHFEKSLGAGDQESSDVQRVISTWMVLNTQATFRDSINSSIDYWCFVSSIARERPHDIGEVIEGNRDLLGRFRESTTVKIRQLTKARAELAGISKSSQISIETEVQFRQVWTRLDLSLDSNLADVEKLLRNRAADLQRRMTNIQIEESRTAIQQAETVKRLTRLAFIFIPISATCSAFGMNVHELVQGQPPPIWVALVVMLGVTFATIFSSLETTHNIFWAFAWLMEPLMPRQMTKSKSEPSPVWKDVKQSLVHHEDNNMQPSWLPRYSSTQRERSPNFAHRIRQLAKLALDLCLLPWLALAQLSLVGAQYKRRRVEMRLGGHVQDSGNPK